MEKTKANYIGNNALQSKTASVQGDVVIIANEKYYKISNYDLMSPFLMNVVSGSDLWMFISSNGALTAGRRNANNALFPYNTDDRIHDSQEITGSKTIVYVLKNRKNFLWEPFSLKYQGIYQIERNIYKNITSDRLVFEEINHDLKVTFQYTWSNCEQFGFIKKSRFVNYNQEPVGVNIVDGIQNILPPGVDRKFQLEFSTLLDGYKKNELQAETGLAVYTLSSIPTDRAEPNEALKATTVWSAGLENAKILLSSTQIEAFRLGHEVTQETDVHAARGAYFLFSHFQVGKDLGKEWYIVADVNKDQAEVVALSNFISSEKNIILQIENEINRSSENLKARIAQADGYQLTGDPLNVFRHCSNTLFNIMRGGIFDNDNYIARNDFRAFLQTANKQIAAEHADFVNELPDQFRYDELINAIVAPDADFEKLCYEYLPLTFSRRHGDPSRPWNQFSIDIKDTDGNKVLNYQGNWRDIFQNWEALALAFPGYIENMIIKFVNASTADGYNPYRVTRDGFDWELPNPAERWSNIGYWGDHQIIYLLKLLELSVNYHPGTLSHLLTKEIFAYADVPYRIKSYQDILLNPHDTIDFDFKHNTEIEKRVHEIGSDGKFVRDKKNQIYHVNLTEKLLVPLLVKFSNFIPEAGIWMNTQRPEWNDANNALVGYGASMVTAYYLRRYIVFCLDLFKNAAVTEIDISDEVFELFVDIRAGLNHFQDVLADSISDRDRKRILDHLGQAGSTHRNKIYKAGFCGNRRPLPIADLISFLETGLKYIEHSIQSNKRDDDLYHSYNLIKITDQHKISVRHMYEMLEGQVAVLSSGYLPYEDTIMLLSSLRKSALYRKNQSSYLLYPNRQLPRFFDKNIIPKELLAHSSLLKRLLKHGDRTIAIRDDFDNVHFNSHFRNAQILKNSLDELKISDPDIAEADIQEILDIYEAVFDHQSFTGRSGTLYKYEGLGSIYWHMVSKLLLAVQEIFYHADADNVNESILDKLTASYYEIRAGIGTHKSPELYGAFPTDPYSHTPKNGGAEQPGMTGQVKEDLISRFGELGVRICDGKIKFNTALIDKNEFLIKSQVFPYYEVNGKEQTIMLSPGMLAFTICQVPVIYVKSKENRIVISTRDGRESEIDGLEIDAERSSSIFQREDNIYKIQVMVADKK